MPDLQTELSKVINTWNQTEKPMEQQTAPTPTPAPTHVGQAVFELVKTHPGRTMAEYEHLAPTIGVSAASVKNYIVNFSKASWGLAKCDNDHYTVCSDTYKTINEMMGIPKGKRISKAKRRKIIKARTLPLPSVQTAQPKQAQVGKGVLQDLLLGHVKTRPGVSRGHLVAFAVKHGMKEDSAKVTIRALIVAGKIIERDDAGLYLPGVRMVDPMEVQEREEATKVLAKETQKQQRINALVDQVESLTIREARALFEQLQKYFSF